MSWTIVRRDDGNFEIRRDMPDDATIVGPTASEEQAAEWLSSLYAHWYFPDGIPGEKANAPSGANAPYKIKKVDGEWAVVNNTGAVKAKFGQDRDKAINYLRALYANVPGAAKRADKTKFTGKMKDRVPTVKAAEQAKKPMVIMVGDKEYYPISSAKDAVDAYNLRNNNKAGISEARVVAHIRAACKALGLPLPPAMRSGS